MSHKFSDPVESFFSSLVVQIRDKCIEKMTSETYSNHLINLLQIFARKSYTAQGCEKGSSEYEIIQHCKSLLKEDYTVIELSNLYGEHCPNYPSRILIPETEITSSPPPNGSTSGYSAQDTIYESNIDISRLKSCISKAKFARCRKRFPVPVISYKGKYICRSATVSLDVETTSRRAMDYFQDGSEPTENGDDDIKSNLDEPVSGNWSVLSNDSIYKMDIDLLDSMNVSTIFDLMVEMKKVKYWMYVSSSEKADHENRYSNFDIVCIPYPGCEFFKDFRDNNYLAEGLKFNWHQEFIDVNIKVPENIATKSLQIEWEDYKSWDLVHLTQNYLKLILRYIQDSDAGVLLHCISGWDRTPLFISLVRLSLWADGLVHKSLSPAEITYFTLAYDWYLFGHQLPDRCAKEEEILFFCFHFLKYIAGEEFQTVSYSRNRTKTISSSSSSSIVVISNENSHDGDSFDDENISPNKIYRNENGMTSTKTPAENITTSRSPQKKTSPMMVPNATGKRQRNESTSSMDGFCYVTETGSLDTSGFVGLSCANRSFLNDKMQNNLETRRQRLFAVRVLFIKAFSQAIGLKFQEGSNMTLTSFLGNVVDMVGLFR